MAHFFRIDGFRSAPLNHPKRTNHAVQFIVFFTDFSADRFFDGVCSEKKHEKLFPAAGEPVFLRMGRTCLCPYFIDQHHDQLFCRLMHRGCRTERTESRLESVILENMLLKIEC